MNESQVIQGRLISPHDIEWIRSLIQQYPKATRRFLSKQICETWQWVDSAGRLKDMACRTLLLKLDRRGIIQLPPLPGNYKDTNHRRGLSFQPVFHDTTPIECALKDIAPISLHIAESGCQRAVWQTLLHCYHYMGFKTRVGKSISYLAFDRFERPVGCFLFGAAAWKVAPRDQFIGWTSTERQKNLEKIANNMRFLIPPWVRVPHLASHLLSKALRQLSNDWKRKYNTGIFLAETFVDKSRFNGVCYKAANWIYVGDTQGRSRNDVHNDMIVPIKAVFLHPLCHDFKSRLKGEE